MARKSARKTSEDVIDDSEITTPAVETVEATPVVPDDPAPSKSRVKVPDDAGASGSVGISDIRKAVAFVNSVGGLDKAVNLLQILKVAREVQ